MSIELLKCVPDSLNFRSLGGALVGLDNRFKTYESLVRKVELGVLRKNLSWSDKEEDATEGDLQCHVAWNISDALRYTIVIETHAYTKMVTSTLQALTSKGIKSVSLKNYWIAGNGYGHATLQVYVL